LQGEGIIHAKHKIKILDLFAEAEATSVTEQKTSLEDDLSIREVCYSALE